MVILLNYSLFIIWIAGAVGSLLGFSEVKTDIKNVLRMLLILSYVR